MIKRQFKKFASLFAFFLIGALPHSTVAVPAGNRPVVIVNSETASRLLFSQTSLGAIFGMRLRKWEDGSPIKVFVLPDDDLLHIEFSKYILHVFPYQLRAAWDRLVFSGTGEEPVKVKSEKQMRELVGSTPGAIGYLRGSMIDDTVKAIAFE
ncbi:MAG: hypothetical protein JNM60_11510 [Candidatus Competibacteraceae bacterium]|nr:hypothetical protein [Candidatus Competibacteraceae bacterium]